MKLFSRVCIALVVLAAGLFAAGCGSGDDGDSGGSGSDADSGAIATSDLAKQEWIAEANEICTESAERLATVSEEQFGDQPPEGDAIEEFAVNEIVPEFQRQVDEIRDLGAPAGDEETVQAILDKMDTGLQDLRDDPSAVNESASDLLIGEAGTEIQEYGVGACGIS